MFSNSPLRPYAARVSHDISPRELAARMKQPDSPLLVDVREPSEAALARIEGALLIPLKTLPQHLDELDKTREIVLCCHHGVRSLMALGFMKRAGFSKLLNLKGGIAAWSRDVDPKVPHY